jgi:hypothetical protein
MISYTVLTGTLYYWSHVHSLEIPQDDWGCIDDCIDDGISIVPDISNNWNRANAAMLLASHTVCHPLDQNENIVREDRLSLSKLAEEGTLAE